MKQIPLTWRVAGHVKNFCPAPTSITKQRVACNGNVTYDPGLDYYVCRDCRQISTPDEVHGLEPWRGEL